MTPKERALTGAQTAPRSDEPGSLPGSTALSARCGARSTQPEPRTSKPTNVDAEASNQVKGNGMNQKQSTTHFKRNPAARNRPHRDGSGVTAAFVLGAAMMLGLLWLLTRSSEDAP